MSEGNVVERKRRIPRGLVFPILLIVVGVIMLLDNIGQLSDGALGTLIRLWPLLFIIGALDDLLGGERLAMATFSLSFGVIFILHNFGQLPWSAWEMLFRLWPLFIVAIGLDLVFGKRSILMGVLGAVIVLVMGAGLWALTGPRAASGMAAVNSETISQPIGSAERARIYLSPAAAEFQLQALRDSKDLIAGRIKPLSGERIVQTPYSVDNGQGYVWLRSTGELMWTRNQSFTDPNWDLGVSSTIPLDLEVNMGVGEMRQDLTGLQIERFKANMGVGKILVTLPAGGDFSGDISLGVGEIEVIVPAGTAVRVRNSAALVGVSMPPGWNKNGQVYTSPGYNSAADKISLDLNLAIGSIRVRVR